MLKADQLTGIQVKRDYAESAIRQQFSVPSMSACGRRSSLDPHGITAQTTCAPRPGGAWYSSHHAICFMQPNLLTIAQVSRRGSDWNWSFLYHRIPVELAIDFHVNPWPSDKQLSSNALASGRRITLLVDRGNSRRRLFSRGQHGRAVVYRLRTRGTALAAPLAKPDQRGVALLRCT